MKNLQENFYESINSDSEIGEKGSIEKMQKNENMELVKILEDDEKIFSSDFIIEEIKKLNPEVKIETDEDMSIIFSSVGVEKLVLPEGFYYNQSNKITNKYTTQSVKYTEIQVYPIEYYNSDSI